MKVLFTLAETVGKKKAGKILETLADTLAEAMM